MSIQMGPAGFYEWPDNPLLPRGLGMQSSRLDDCENYFQSGSFAGVFGHPGYGFTETTLDCLSRFNAAEWLWIWDANLKNCDGIQALQSMTYCGVTGKRTGIDFSQLPALRTVINHWYPKDTGLNQSAIENYTLWHYKPRTKSFDGLQIPEHVKKLEMNWVNPESLLGLPVMPDLERLEFYYCRNLRVLSDLPRIAPNLKYFAVTSCTKTDATSGLTQHPNLEFAYINDKVVVNRMPLANEG